MEQIHITLPDGSVKGRPPRAPRRPMSPGAYLPRLADAALVAASGCGPTTAKASWSTCAVRFDHDVKLQILTEKDPDSLFVFSPFRCASALAAAVVGALSPT